MYARIGRECRACGARGDLAGYRSQSHIVLTSVLTPAVSRRATSLAAALKAAPARRVRARAETRTGDASPVREKLRPRRLACGRNGRLFLYHRKTEIVPEGRLPHRSVHWQRGHMCTAKRQLALPSLWSTTGAGQLQCWRPLATNARGSAMIPRGPPTAHWFENADNSSLCIALQPTAGRRLTRVRLARSCQREGSVARTHF